MNLEEYHKMYALEKNYWWFQGRRKVVLDLLEKTFESSVKITKPVVLDIGCGTGMLLEDLTQKGNAVGLDFSSVALSYCKNRGLNKLGRADVRYLPIKSNSVDVITALDLIEHIEDDRGLMDEFQRVLKPGGVAIMSVPAHKSLWSNHDVALHHFRRYEKPEFLALINNAGLTPIKYTYSMATAFFPAVALRTVQNLFKTKKAPETNEFPLPSFINSFLKKKRLFGIPLAGKIQSAFWIVPSLHREKKRLILIAYALRK